MQIPTISKQKELSSKQISEINSLWNEEYPINLKDRLSILLAETKNNTHYLMEENNEIIAWAIIFDSQNEVRFSIIVSSRFKNLGLGTILMDRLKLENPEFYGWVIDNNNDLKNNGENYLTPIPFYLKHGFEILTEQRLETPIISCVKIKWGK